MYLIDKLLFMMLLLVVICAAGGLTAYNIIDNYNDAKVYDLMSQRGYEQVAEKGLGRWVWQKSEHVINQRESVTIIVPETEKEKIGYEGRKETEM